MLVTVTIAAGETKEFREECDYFRILASSGPSVDLVFIRDGAVLSDAAGISPGYSEEWTRPIDTVRITASVTQTIKFVMRIGSKVSYDVPPGGTLVFPASQGAFLAQFSTTVNTTSAAVLGANTGRKYLLIQNNDSAVTIHVNLMGVGATSANGIKIGPGGSYECTGYLPSAQITAVAIGSANSNVLFVEG